MVFKPIGKAIARVRGKSTPLREKLMLRAVATALLMGLVYMSAVAWVIRQQYLDQSQAHLQKAASIIEENLNERRNNLLSAARDLAGQKNLGSTIWYLEQYAHSNLDRETLFNTYQQLARDAYKVGRAANASKVTIYDASGQLVTFALFGGEQEQAGFVERLDEPVFRVANFKGGDDFSAAQLRSAAKVAGAEQKLPGPLPRQEDVHYAVIDGLVSIETQVPVMGEVFDRDTGRPREQQLGLITMVQVLDLGFVRQLAGITDTEINVFSQSGLSSGTLSAYQQANWRDLEGGGSAGQRILMNAIDLGGAGYYQGLIPLHRGNQVVGSVATLRSKAVVQKNISEMVLYLGLLVAASLLVIVPFAWFFASTIARPLTLLSGIFRGAARREQTAVAPEELAQLDKGRSLYREMDELTESFLAMHDAVNQKISQINEINASLELTVEERTAALAAKERESRTLIENTPDTIARYDRECRRLFINTAFSATAGRPAEDYVGKTPSQFPGGANAEIYETKIREVFASGQNAQFELRWNTASNEEICSHIRLTPEFDAHGAVVTVLAVGRDISDRIAFEKTIWRQANFDALTQLPNRQMFHDRLEQETRIAHRSGHPLALMLIDLDHFKEVNDTMGHDKGDNLLVEAARRITSAVRETDTVARLGGDEFTVILSSISDPGNVERVATEIIRKLSEPFALERDEAFVSASIGITLYPDDTRELDVLLKNADQAMYAAKSAGRNRFSFFTADLQEAAQKRLRITNELRGALANQQFRIFYQPIVELSSGAVRKAEALIRWQHADGRMISPGEFIPLAEETGLIIPIGDWVFQEAVRQAGEWRRRFDADFQISVNKSPVQIRRDESVIPLWIEYLRQHHVAGQGVVIEITEGLLLHAEADINRKLLAYRDAGVQVAIDDFGTGYSSLAYLKKFDIDYLKIDRSFIINLGVDKDDLALCEAIIVMAHKLGLKVIAEGVETATQRDLLLAAGCDYAQGYLFSRPVPPEEFEAFMQKHGKTRTESAAR